MPQAQAKAAPRAKPGRKRSADAERAVLSATLDLLEGKPLREITADAIAAKAGVSKATLYKWWPNKALVAFDAFLVRMRSEVPVPDTGSARRDFVEQLRSVIRFYSGPWGRVFGEFVAEGQHDSAFRKQFHARFLDSRRESARVMWRRGVARGELRKEIDPEVAIDLVHGPTIYRLLAGHAPLDDREAEKLIDAALHGLATRRK